MALVAKAGVATSVCAESAYTDILAALDSFGLPMSTNCTAKMLLDSALSDKKRFGGTVNLIIPKKIGECIIQATPIEELLMFIEAGL